MKKITDVSKSLILMILLTFLSGLTPARAAAPAAEGSISEYNLSSLDWKLWGFQPEFWGMGFNFNTLTGPNAEVRNIPAPVPGSVQKALLEAGIIPDWNTGNNFLDIEWIENRHWIYVTRLPDEWIDQENVIRLNCRGLDDNGVVLVNGEEVGKFDNTFIPWQFEITPFLKERDNTLAILFKCPPSYLGQIGYTSRIKDWKPRFYYGWDWIPRIVQVGIWDEIFLESYAKESARILAFSVDTETEKDRDQGNLRVAAEMTPAAFEGKARIQLINGEGASVIDETIACTALGEGKTWKNLKIKRWWPNGAGNQPLYNVRCSLYDKNDNLCQVEEKTIGFKHVAWLPNKGAPPEADPWICAVNNKPVFLQGVNWTPIRPNFADLTEADYRQLINTYQELGINVFRVWGGGFPEKEWFYNLCDETGIMIYQDFPLSSSGLDNYPPDTPEEIFAMSKIAESYVKRLRHHASLLLWCGGNELYERDDSAPVTDQHPMIRGIKNIVGAKDPTRRFVAASPSGPGIIARRESFGKGILWDVHGPWKLPFTRDDSTMTAVREFWNADDALMHSEAGVAGAMSAEMIHKYRGELPALPATRSNPLWREVEWWIEWDDFKRDHGGREPESLEAYVAWSQQRQAEGLSIALEANKSRFPASGGFIIWMGHDSYPCPVNTSIIDFDGNIKPAARRLSKIWKRNY